MPSNKYQFYMTKSFHFKIRRLHRYLGLILGIQFLLWTIGGLYFSWSDMDEVHGDHHKAHVHPMSVDMNLVSPQSVLDKIKLHNSIQYIFDIRLIQLLGQPIYQVTYAQDHEGHKKIQLANAKTGALRPALQKEEAVKLASISFSEEAKIKQVEYITSTDGHHEYREQPLPAYAITFEHPTNTTVYVSCELATVQKFRNNKWRIFDFLWMLHTMGYQDRDNLSNWLLRAFSIFGLCTILSGFVLFWVSSKKN